MLMARHRRCGRPNFVHLLFFLSMCMVVIFVTLYYLNSNLGSRYNTAPFAAFPAPDAIQNFKADFRTLPHSLPGGRRRLVVLINSHWRNFDLRLAIRNTWASNQNRMNCSVFFVVGDSDDKLVQSVSEEAGFFKDVIQPTVLESEQNTVLKLLAAFRFVERELDADFVMKTNDDVFVNLTGIVSFLQPYASGERSYSRTGPTDWHQPQKLIFGNRMKNGTATDRKSPSLQPNDIPLPEYVSGFGYVVSFDVMRRFIVCPNVVGLLPMEDAYFTGLCRQHFGLPLVHVEKFRSTARMNVPCLWKTRLIINGVKANEMDSVWNVANKKTAPTC